ncbi:hypothetical protein ABH924_001907 [Arthrobacter sp. GAS37]
MSAATHQSTPYTRRGQVGVTEALANLKKYDYPPSQTSFDAAFNQD